MQTDTDAAAKKLCAKRPKGKLYKHTFWADERGRTNLRFIRNSYAALLDREVSVTIVIRRAVEVLAERITEASAVGARMDHELAALMRHVG